jgi:2'-5' RNA ligase superfamily
LRLAPREAIADVRGPDEAPEPADGFRPHATLAYRNADNDAAPVRERLARPRSPPPATVDVRAAQLIVLDPDNNRCRWSVGGHPQTPPGRDQGDRTAASTSTRGFPGLAGDIRHKSKPGTRALRSRFDGTVRHASTSWKGELGVPKAEVGHVMVDRVGACSGDQSLVNGLDE